MCSKSKTTNPVELPPDGCMDTRNRKSQSDVGGVIEGDNSLGKDVEATKVAQSGLDGKYGPEHRHLQHDVSSRPAGGEYLVPQTQPELVGHSIACVPYPYSNQYYGGLMTTAYGAQTLVNPHLLGMHQPRMCLPLEMTEDPVYVNPKQYNGIMRRRKSRAKAELERKLIKNRKPYLHESRHQHAMRRERGCGGRFLNKKKLNDGAKPTPEERMESAAAPSTQSTSPSSSAVTTQCTGKLDASNGQEEFEGLMRVNMSGQHTYSNEDGDGNSCYQDRQDFKVSAFHSLSGERGEEGDCSGQLRGSILVRQTSHRALTIQ